MRREVYYVEGVLFLISSYYSMKTVNHSQLLTVVCYNQCYSKFRNQFKIEVEIYFNSTLYLPKPAYRCTKIITFHFKNSFIVTIPLSNKDDSNNG